MDDHERENYEEFNPQYVGCSICGEMIHHEDFRSENGECEECFERESKQDEAEDLDEADQKDYPQSEPPIFDFDFFKKAAGYK